MINGHCVQIQTIIDSPAWNLSSISAIIHFAGSEMILEGFLLVCAYGLWTYWKFKQKTKYWSDRGVPEVSERPLILFGNAMNTHPDYILGRRSKYYKLLDQCEEMKGHKYYGTYGLGCIPTLTLMDLEVVEDVMVRDCEYFVDRINRDNPFNPLLSTSKSDTDKIWHAMIPFQSGAEWKATRSVFSPIFTSGKMRLMLGLIQSLSADLEREVARMERSGTDVELRQLFGRFSLDCMGSCVFGIEIGTLKKAGKSQEGEGGQGSEFVRYASKAFEVGMRDMVVFLISLLPVVGPILKKTKFPMVKPEETKFFAAVIRNTLKHRSETKTRRNDLVDLMLDALQESGNGTQSSEENLSIVSTAIRAATACSGLALRPLSCGKRRRGRPSGPVGLANSSFMPSYWTKGSASPRQLKELGREPSPVPHPSHTTSDGTIAAMAAKPSIRVPASRANSAPLETP